MKIIKFTKEIRNAIHDVVLYQTLPSQIDYQRPWELKAEKALRYIDSLPTKTRIDVLNAIREEVDEYYTPDELTGMSASDHAEMY